eukprot:TRINITY_DN76086_c0_g1_i1.p1 TRINITY_DN76086_c0_g1~~TRINITY_DN76086_c0_g1_i1.p1  ORF type:complete len:268 (-),score=52.50 TRINITY_DN76086_c0_g1_i1:63-845(-)
MSRLSLGLFLSPAAAWMPVTHQYLGSLDHVRSGSHSFLAGCVAPDAYKHFAPWLHSLDFAAYLWERARSTGNQDVLDFALGWGCHIAHDLVGHHSGGFLNPKHDHLLELAADAFLWHTAPALRYLQPIDGVREKLVVEASRDASRGSSGSMPEISEATAASSTSSFSMLATAERAVLVLDMLYESQIVSYSACPVANFSAALANFRLATNWSQAACAAWQHALLEGAAREVAVSKVTGFVQQLFDGNEGSSCAHRTFVLV